MGWIKRYPGARLCDRSHNQAYVPDLVMWPHRCGMLVGREEEGGLGHITGYRAFSQASSRWSSFQPERRRGPTKVSEGSSHACIAATFDRTVSWA